MPEYRTQALVLRTFDYGESDRLVHLYTFDVGRVSAIAKGARRSRKRFPGTLEIFNLLDTRFVDPPRASLMRLETASLMCGFEGLTRRLSRYALACQLLELLDRFTGERDANPSLFAFARGVLGVIDEDRPDLLLQTLILAKTLARLGFRPELLACAACGVELADAAGPPSFVARHGGAVCAACAEPHEPTVSGALLRALEAGIRSPLRERHGLGLDRASVGELHRLVDRFFRFHIGSELRTSRFVEQAFRREDPASDEGEGPRGDVRARLDGDETRGDTAPALSEGEESRPSVRSEPRL